ncbi:MAG: glycosyltransferase family 4 protein [Tannerellaceae bacterium]|jgi:glycosyltransferase involved in cell wall biosynthesis|nr:glycosyltransferase family 4 protein [Tannerellaceae bacterium]
MKIAFIIAYPTSTMANGIISQALSWKKGLEMLGHEVELVDMWKGYDWSTFAVIHYFGFSSFSSHHIRMISPLNESIVVSPILDPNYPVWQLWVYARWGSTRLKLTNNYHSLYVVRNCIKKILTRSEFETFYMVRGFGFRREQCEVVPLALDIVLPPAVENFREPFCLHISLLADKRKNVKRLIEAAKKYKFNLVLAGYTTPEGRRMIEQWIGGASHIEYLGYLPTPRMLQLYSRAKVFALPSLNEGVGLVGLEAAAMGCDVVLTHLGGPKEYYNGMVSLVDPFDVDAIGTAIVDLLGDKTFQPRLSQYMKQSFTMEKMARKLLDVYIDIKQE